VKPVKYEVDEKLEIYIEYRGNGKWAITRWSNVLSKDGNWHIEPQPSSRDDEYLSENRFDSEYEAKEFLEKTNAIYNLR
jgi:hypothetical protein